MNKRDRETIAGIVAALFLLPAGYVLWFKMGLTNVYTIFGVPIIAATLYGVTFRLLPSKKKTTNKNTPKKTTKNSTLVTPKKHLSEKELLLSDIDLLSGEDFEELCFLYFQDKGYYPEKTPKSGDHGVDLVIKDPKDGLKIAVQCKRYKSTIGNGELLKLEAGKRFYKCSKTLFITTSNFTTKAKEYAEKCKMDIWNGLIVEDRIGKWRKRKLKKLG